MSPEEAAVILDSGHDLLAQTLRLLGQSEARQEMATAVDLLERVISAVDPERLSRSGDPWLYFYEDFLAAYSQRAFEERVKAVIPKFEDRYIEKWPRPPDFAPGITLAFRIVTPWSAITAPLTGSKGKKVTWLPNAPESKATEIDILITQSTITVSGWPGKRSMGTSMIGSIPLESGETLWAVYWIVDMPDLSSFGKGVGRFYRGRNKEDLMADGLRALVFGAEPDGSKVIYDCAVQGRTTKNQK